MMLCRVDGNVTATVKHKSAHGWRFVICQPITADGVEIGSPTIAIDPLGSGLHSRVMVTTDGKHATELLNCRKTPIRNSVVGIIDT